MAGAFPPTPPNTGVSFTSVQVGPQGGNASIDNQQMAGLQIEIGTITADDQLAEFSVSADGGVFTDYLVVNHYERDYHRYIAGLASPQGFRGQTVASFRLSNAVGIWIADWTAARLGVQPVVPDPNPTDPTTWILLNEMIGKAAMQKAADGVNTLYRISGTYVYGCLKPAQRSLDDTVFPMPPYLNTPDDRTTPSNFVQHGIIDQNQSTLQAGGAIPPASPGVP